MRLECPASRGTTTSCFAALLVGVCMATSAAAQVSVSELEVHLRLAGDALTLVREIPVKNDEQRPQRVRVIVGDWVRDSVGNNVFNLPADGVSARCGSRLKVSPTSFEVAPRTTARV